MPTFAIYTNLPKDKIPGNFLLDASSFIAKRLGKPESVWVVIPLIMYNQQNKQQIRGDNLPCERPPLLYL